MLHARIARGFRSQQQSRPVIWKVLSNQRWPRERRGDTGAFRTPYCFASGNACYLTWPASSHICQPRRLGVGCLSGEVSRGLGPALRRAVFPVPKRYLFDLPDAATHIKFDHLDKSSYSRESTRSRISCNNRPPGTWYLERLHRKTRYSSGSCEYANIGAVDRGPIA